MNKPSVSVRNLTKSFSRHRAVSRWMPLGVGISSLKSVSMGCYNNIVIPVITLTAITVICGTIAVKTFRWE